MKKICIFCSSSEVDLKFANPAVELCSQFGALGWELVWGGSDVGLMKLVADTVQSSGAAIHGVTLDRLSSATKKGATTMYMAQTLAERVDRMIEISDAFVILPGGSGTLDELAHVLELRRLNYHNKPIMVFNIEQFYEGLLAYFETAFQNKMQFIWIDQETRVNAPIDSIIHIAHTAPQVVAKLRGLS